MNFLTQRAKTSSTNYHLSRANIKVIVGVDIVRLFINLQFDLILLSFNLATSLFLILKQIFKI